MTAYRSPVIVSRCGNVLLARILFLLPSPCMQTDPFLELGAPDAPGSHSWPLETCRYV